jgi:hypothetical protein
MEVLRYKPKTFLRLDDTTPVQDYSGYNNTTAVTTGTISKGIALTSDALYSVLYDVDSYLNVTVKDVYEKNKESHPWSISAVVCMTIPGENQIVSKGANDGLSINGTVVSFGTRYTSNGTASCSYDIGFPRKVNIVGVHTETKNSLFIDGELVAEVDITPEQQADTFAPGTTVFNSGDGTGAFLVNNIGFFARALRTEEIQAIYLHDERRPGDSAAMFGGEIISTGRSMRPRYLDTGWYSDNDWNQGQLYQVEAEDGILYASMVDELTLGGQWMGSVSVFQGNTPVSINSINFWWEGKNVTVEASTNGTSWSAITRGTKIPNYSTNATPASDSLFIRVTFPSGVDEAWIKNLRVNGFTGSTVVYTPDRTITYPSSAVLYDDEIHPNKLRDDWGVDLKGGLWSISNTVVADRPKTVEVWWKRSAAVTLSTNLTNADTTYTNGAVVGDRPNEWVVKHFVYSLGFAGLLSISGSVTIGRVVFYDTALSATDVANIVEAYSGYDKLTTTDGSFSIAESPTAWKIYGHDWEIQQS